MKPLYAVVAALIISGMAFAQQEPPPAQEHPGGKPPPREGRGPGGPGGPGGPEGRRGPGMSPGGSGMGGPGMGGENDPRMRQFEMLRGYLDAVDRYAKLSRDSVTSGIAAVVATADILRPRGTSGAIEHFNKVLPEVKNEAVQRAIRLQLVDLYKAAGQQDKALEELQKMMTAPPAGAEPIPPGPPPPGR